MVLAEGKRMVIPASGAVIGRSRDADIVLSDPNVSRRHAEIRPAGRGRWTVNDMGSTNGVKVNGTLISGDHPLRAGDRIALGTADMRFVVE
jgi:pSer/pThr/pTyr-binding forkhead associated (FHA) protein